MKKLLKRHLAIALSAALLLSSGLCLNAKNTPGEVAYGTPVVDGVLDEAYLQTDITESVRNNVFMYPWNKLGGEAYNQTNFPGRATSYFLWDEDCFYVCTVVKDSDVYQRPAEYYNTPFPWEADSVTGYFSRGSDWFSLFTEAYGTMWYASDGTSKFGVEAWADVPAVGKFSEPNYSNMDCSSLFATTLTEDGYIVEVGLKIKDGVKYAAGDEIKYALQLNDVFDINGDVGYAIGSQNPKIQGLTLTLVEPGPSENSGLLTVNTAENYIAGETVNIPVTIEKNPGVAAMTIEPVFDESVFEFIEIKAGEGEFATATTFKRYVWAKNGGNVTENGTVCTIVLKIRDDAPHGQTTVSLNYSGSTWKEETPDIFPIDGTVTVHGNTDIVTDQAVEATCTANGLTEGRHCSVCEKVIVAQQIIPSPGHDFEEKFTIDFAPTADAPGQKSRHCKNCDEITDVTEISMILGDINGDGAVDTKDLTRLMKHIAGYEVETINPDINSDEKVDTKDLTRLMKYLAGAEA